ncbi:hypothetical protein CCYA_CCYA01G0138 [Cyanidiococcus yangmingshanensis]|nr:hypothetical protein CCYA_CCYA01G0138 [Cyanidiococcus yangmingshanensis]
MFVAPLVVHSDRRTPQWRLHCVATARCQGAPPVRIDRKRPRLGQTLLCAERQTHRHDDGNKSEGHLKSAVSLFERIAQRFEGFARKLQQRLSRASTPADDASSVVSEGARKPQDAQVDTNLTLTSALCAYGVPEETAAKVAVQSSSSTWHRALQCFAAGDCSSASLATMLEKNIECLEEKVAAQLVDFVRQVAAASSLETSDWWSLLADTSMPLTTWFSFRNELVERLQQLAQYGLDSPELLRMIVPEQLQSLLHGRGRFEQVLVFLTTEPPNGCGFEPDSDGLKRLATRAPWLLALDSVDVARTIVQYLTQDLCLGYAPYIRQIVYAYPEMLRTDVTHIRAIHEYLRERCQLSTKHIGAMVRSYPRCLALPLARIERVTGYLHCLGLCRDDLIKVYRAFPALLALDIERDAEPVVSLFREYGLTDIAGLVRGLPPLLLYDIEQDIRPKLKFLQSVMNMDIQSVFEFPAFFSYSLRDRIAPRLLYLRRLGFTAPRLRLSIVIAPSDTDFCRRVARTSQKEFLKFKEEFDQLIASRMQQVAVKSADAQRMDVDRPQATTGPTHER